MTDYESDDYHRTISKLRDLLRHYQAKLAESEGIYKQVSEAAPSHYICNEQRLLIGVYKDMIERLYEILED